MNDSSIAGRAEPARDANARFCGRLPMEGGLARVTAHVWGCLTQDLALAGFSARTQLTYLHAVRDFIEFHGKSIAEFEQKEVRAWVGALLERKLSPSRLRHHFAALKFLFCRTLGRASAVSFLSWPKAPERLQRIPTRAEVRRLLLHVREPRHRVLFTLMYATGLRLGEVCRLETRDIDSAQAVIHVRQGKGRRDRVVPLDARLLELLRAYWRFLRPPEPLLFVSRRGCALHPGVVRTALRRAGVAAGVAGRVTPHSLRHAFATHLLDEGLDVRVIQAVLGHRSIRTTARYTHVSTVRVAAMPSPMAWL